MFLPKINPSIFQDKIIQIQQKFSYNLFKVQFFIFPIYLFFEKEKGFVYVVGSNAYNQLGLDSDVDLYSTLLELNHTKIVDVAGLSHTILLAGCF